MENSQKVVQWMNVYMFLKSIYIITSIACTCTLDIRKSNCAGFFQRFSTGTGKLTNVPYKGTIAIGNTSSNHHFSGNMLVFRGVKVPLVHWVFLVLPWRRHGPKKGPSSGEIYLYTSPCRSDTRRSVGQACASAHSWRTPLTKTSPSFRSFFPVKTWRVPQVPSFWRCRRAITIGSGLPTFFRRGATSSDEWPTKKRHQVLDPCRRDCGLQRTLWGLSVLGGEKKTRCSLWKVNWSCLLLLVLTHFLLFFIFFWMPRLVGELSRNDSWKQIEIPLKFWLFP